MIVAKLVLVAALSQGQCGVSHVGAGVLHARPVLGLFGRIRERRSARISMRLTRRSARLNAVAGIGCGSYASIGCGTAEIGCGESAKSPVQKEGSPVQKEGSPTQKADGDAVGGSDLPDPPAFSGNTLTPAQFPTSASVIELTDFRMALRDPPATDGAILVRL